MLERIDSVDFQCHLSDKVIFNVRVQRAVFYDTHSQRWLSKSMQEIICEDKPSQSKLTKSLFFIIVFTTLQTASFMFIRSNYFAAFKIYQYDKTQNSTIEEILPAHILNPGECLQNRYVSLSGFQYCTNLDNSTFDSFTFFHAFEGSMLSKSIPHGKVISLLDMQSQSIYNTLAKEYINELDLKRFACHAVANGDTYSNLTTSKFIHQFNPTVYFNSIIPEFGPLAHKPLELPSYQLAYLIMIDEPSGLKNFQMLVGSLATDGLAIILIHIDAKSPTLAVEAKIWIDQKGYTNVFITQTSFSGRWGHSTLVNIQLNGFYELLRLSKSWEYVINLSNYDWPMRTNEQIYKFLSDPQRKGKTFINYMSDNLEVIKRVASTVFRNDRPPIRRYGISKPLGNVIRSFPYRSWIIRKHHQW